MRGKIRELKEGQVSPPGERKAEEANCGDKQYKRRKTEAGENLREGHTEEQE